MKETLHTRLDERLPASIRRSPEGPTCDVIVERFMGVLIHPVPPLEMQEVTGTFRAGGKVVIEWPRDAQGWWDVEPGDELIVEGRALPIRATREHPSCYAEIFVEAP